MEHTWDEMNAKFEILSWKLASIIGKLEHSKLEISLMVKREVHQVQQRLELRISQLEAEVKSLRHGPAANSIACNYMSGNEDDSSQSAQDLVSPVQKCCTEVEEGNRVHENARDSDLSSAAFADRAVQGKIKRSSIRSSARFQARSTSFHQATVYYCLSEGRSLYRKVLMACVSFTIVLMQCVCAGAIILASLAPSCHTVDQCRQDQYCSISKRRCAFCGDGYSLREDSLIYGEHERYHIDKLSGLSDSSFACEVDDSICDSCYDVVTHTFSTVGLQDAVHANVGMMKDGDWIAFVLISSMVAMSVAAELREIQLCNISCMRSGRCKWWPSLIHLLNFLRRYILLPLVSCDVALLVVYVGSDAMSICLNVVGILFLMNVDNELYDWALSEQVRAEVTTHGSVDLTAREQTLLDVTGRVYFTFLAIISPALVRVAHVLNDIFEIVLFFGVVLIPLAFRLLEVLIVGETLGSRLRGVIAAIANVSIGVAMLSQMSNRLK